ncbi:MAG: hypothetical protein ACYDBZ_09925 [Steroidobacteraceae bacterium]
MSVARAGTLGATRICPHCKAVVLQSANICPGCHHHLRFNSSNAEPQAESVSAMRIEGSIRHTARDESCEYCVVISITNERGEKIARQVVGVGALQPGEKHKYSFSVDLMPARSAAERKRN